MTATPPALTSGQTVGFEPMFSTPGRFIHHRNFEVWLDANDSSAIFAGDSSLRVVASTP